MAMDSAIQRWHLLHPPREGADEKPTPTVDEFDQMKETWKSKDKVAKVLGMFSGPRLFSDWQIAKPNENDRNNATWDEFKTAMNTYYAPTENLTLSNYQFRNTAQMESESFATFCIRVEKEAKSCSFKCHHIDCTAENVAVRDQILFGTTNSKIREEALLKGWNLTALRTEGTKLESASRGEAEISGGAVNRIGRYSFSSLKNKGKYNSGSGLTCYNCGEKFKGPAYKHNETCKAKNQKCKLCGKFGHVATCCRSNREIKFSEAEQPEEESVVKEHPSWKVDISDEMYNVNIFKVNTTGGNEFRIRSSVNKAERDFKVEVVVNGSVATITADTGAIVSVCGEFEAQNWNLLNRIVPTAVRIKPYNSPAVPTVGKARCAVTFGSTSIPVEWYILEGKCEPILSGSASVNLGIIHFTKTPPIYRPLNMVNTELKKTDQQKVQEVLAKRPEVFSHKLGKHRSYQVKLHTDPNIKPIVTPPRPTPYHLQDRIQKAINEMIANDVIEEHPVGDPALWISNAVYVPKPNGDIRVTIDARNINKAILSSNLPIPRQEDIKAKLGGKCIFSKLDFRWSFLQILLALESRNLTVFSLNGKLYRYKRLAMGIKSAQGELNAALAPLFRNIPDAHLIHDDLVVASSNITEHIKALDDCFAAIQKEGLTLNEEKCHFCMNEITFWGMILSAEGVRPDPEKVKALDGLERPRNKDELHSFICMMQSVSEFIQSFSRKAAPLRELLNMKGRFKWEEQHQQSFNYLLEEFRKDVALRYFDTSKPIYLFTDAHQTGLGVILAQGDSIESALPVAVASRTTTDAEKRYPQMDLEGLGVDYALYRFRNYLVGSPSTITVVTDHMPLCSIFNGNRSGSVRTERYKQRNQDIKFKVVYKKGKSNQSDFLSRRGAPITKLCDEEQQRADSINNLLYMLHTTPIVDRITLKAIAEETTSDSILSKLQNIVKSGKTWISKDEQESLLKFKNILPEITITGNGILLKGERIILPATLQNLAIQLCHQGSHPGQSSMERRLRYHFFFHDMNIKVSKYLEQCTDCSIYTDKKSKEPLKSHNVPDRCWEKVAVDLFGPMPSQKHIVVVQDLASRFPAAKIVSSTAADKVLPAMSDIYNAYGNPEVQLSDNGPPFNSVAMDKFAEERNIVLEKIPPHHPSANPVETFMRPLGKTMKIANYNRSNDRQALDNLLRNYRDTPHPSTGIPPSAMLFRSSMSGPFPARAVNDDDVEAARKYDRQQKIDKEEQINNSKFKQYSNIALGEPVLVRNYQRTSKFQPLFAPEQYIVTGIGDHGRKLEIERCSDGQTLLRHPDDLKRFHIPTCPTTQRRVYVPNQWDMLNPYYQDQDIEYSNRYGAPPYAYYQPPPPDIRDQPAQQPVPQPGIAPPAGVRGEPNPQQADPIPHQDLVPPQEPRRSDRNRKAPERLGAEVYNEEQPLAGENAVVQGQPWWPGYPRDHN